MFKKVFVTILVMFFWFSGEIVINYMWQEQAYQSWLMSSLEAFATLAMSIVALVLLWRIWRR
jgi:hypothetical protein